MARLDTAMLVHKATEVGGRLNQVQREPAVRKAWGAAIMDCRVAFGSVGRAVTETRSAYQRIAALGASAA